MTVVPLVCWLCLPGVVSANDLAEHYASAIAVYKIGGAAGAAVCNYKSRGVEFCVRHAKTVMCLLSTGKTLSTRFVCQLDCLVCVPTGLVRLPNILNLGLFRRAV